MHAWFAPLAQKASGFAVRVGQRDNYTGRTTKDNTLECDRRQLLLQGVHIALQFLNEILREFLWATLVVNYVFQEAKGTLYPLVA